MMVSEGRRAFVAFNLSPLPPQAQVHSATLVLCLTGIPPADALLRTQELRRVTEPWSESSITWNNQPGTTGQDSHSFRVPTIQSCISVDVTASVRAWLAGEENYGWSITDDSLVALAAVEYATKEGAMRDSAPELNILYSW
jgi:hypothetical protein